MQIGNLLSDQQNARRSLISALT
eukprot:COSAG06_NODE_40712_length_399_cov_1.013333_1_plen_22_part_10